MQIFSPATYRSAICDILTLSWTKCCKIFLALNIPFNICPIFIQIYSDFFELHKVCFIRNVWRLDYDKVYLCYNLYSFYPDFFSLSSHYHKMKGKCSTISFSCICIWFMVLKSNVFLVSM